MPEIDDRGFFRDGDFCVILWGGDEYEIHYKMADTPEKILDWVVEIIKLDWEGTTHERVRALIEHFAQAAGIKFRESRNEDPLVGDIKKDLLTLRVAKYIAIDGPVGPYAKSSIMKQPVLSIAHLTDEQIVAIAEDWRDGMIKLGRQIRKNQTK